MGDLFVRIYDFFARRRVLLWAVLVLVTGTMAFFASRVRYEEQITGFFRGGEEGRRQAMIFDHLKMMDKIVVMFTSADPDRSIACAEVFEELLMAGEGAGYVASVTSDVGTGDVAGTVEMVYGNLPVYLTEEDYRRIDSLLAPGGVERSVAEAYARLSSPLGMALRDVVLRDPLGIGTGKFAALGEFSRMADYEIYDGHIFSPGLETMLVVIEPRHGIGDTGANEVLISAIEQSAREAVSGGAEEAVSGGAEDVAGAVEGSAGNATETREIAEAGFDDVSVEYLGGPSVAVYNARQVKADTWLTLSIALVITVGFILLAFRNRLAVLLIMTPVIFGALFALGAIWLTGQHTMSAIAIGAGAAVLGIALSYSIHVISHANHTDDPRQIVRELAYPLTVGGFTTIGAFLGLTFTGSGLLHDFGLFAALTLVGTTLFCLVFLPHFLARGRRAGATDKAGSSAGASGLAEATDKAGSAGSVKSVGAVGRLIERIGSYPLDRKRWVVWALIAVTGVCLFFYGRVGFDSDMMNLNYMPSHLKVAEERLASFTHDTERQVMFVSTGGDFESAAASYRTTGALLDSLAEEGLIGGYVWAADFLPPPSLQRARIARWNKFWNGGHEGGSGRGERALSRREETTARVEESALTAGFRASAFDGFKGILNKNYTVSDLSADAPENVPAGAAAEFRTDTETGAPIGEGKAAVPPFLADWVGVADDGTVMLVSHVTVTAENKEAVYARFASSPDVVIVDRAYFAGRMAQGISDDFNLTLAIASILIFVALLISYGRIELTLVAFMPMVVSWVIILGLMAILGIEFNIVSIILSTFIFGIGDDFSIFMMDGLLSEYRDGKKILAAHKTAIFFSAFTIVVGLGVMILAKHPAMHSLAVVSILGILAVILVAWVIQPVVFRAFVTSQTRRGGFPYTLAGLANSVYAFIYFLVGCLVLWLVIAMLWVVPVERRRKKLWFHRSVRFATWFFLRTMFTTRRVELNEPGETFEKPAVIIANHTSFIDILVLLGLHPKLVMVTNSWVWRSPFFGWIVRYADFYHTADGYDNLAEALREKVADGYSVVVFPEGTRSADGRIGRFHKGAFYLAEKLGLDILPIVLYGNGLVSSKRQPFYIKKGLLVSKILPRIVPGDGRFGTGYGARARQIGEWFRREYDAVYEEYNRTCNPYFYDALIKSYTYKGPVLEWYMRIKVRMERSYDLFDRLVPREASVVDIGCGYGALAYMLAMLSERRRVLGIDYDEEKIAVAQHSFLGGEHTRFVAADALEFDLPQADVFILGDVLHYMDYEKQDALLERCFSRVGPGGMVIVRDGDAAEQKRHRATERTEKWSTRLVKFNKTVGELHFTDSERIAAAAGRAGFRVRIIDDTVKTSNKIYVCTMS